MERIILDVDTGHDDAVAITLAAGCPDIGIEGLVAVSGNQSLDKTLRNTLNMASMLRLTCPVHAGASRPILRDEYHAGNIHGITGLDGPVFAPHSLKPAEGHGAVFLADTIMKNPGEITLCAVGPLTDVAIALRLSPDIAKNVKRICLMGGSFGQGNTTASAEFNIYADPEAARIVFESGAPIYMFPLDVTLKVLADREKVEKIRKMPGAAARTFAASMDFYFGSIFEATGSLPAMHDPCTVAFLQRPSLFRLEKKRVEICTDEGPCYGRTVDDFKASEADFNAYAAMDVDADGFWNLMFEAFGNLRDL